MFQLLTDGTNWVFLAVVAYVFTRAFEIAFGGNRDKAWYRNLVHAIAVVTLVVAGIAFTVTIRDGMRGSTPAPSVEGASAR